MRRLVLTVALALLPGLVFAQIAYDAESNYTGSYTGSTSFNWTHTPTGTPKGIIVFVGQNTGPSTDEVPGVTYGGETMTEVGEAIDDTSESGIMNAYFLGSSVPTGAQSVVVTVSGSRAKTGAAVSVTATGDTSVDDWGIAEEDQENPTITLSTSAETYIAGGIHSGHGNLVQISPQANYTDIYELDLGGQSHVFARRTSNASAGSPTIGWTAALQDTGAVGVAVKDDSAAVASPRLTLIGIGP